MVRRAARLSREEIRRRDEAVRSAEKTAEESQREVAQLRAALEKEQRARELAERDAGTANDQLREKRVEIAQLRDEIQTLRADSDAAKLKLARLEGEKQAETARVEAERRAAERRSAEANLKETLAKYGTLKETATGFRLVLPETIWSNTRTAALSTASAAKLEPLAALLASNPDYQILIEAYTDNKGNEVSLQQLTQERARVILRSFPVSRSRSNAHSGERHGRFKPAGPEHYRRRTAKESAGGNNFHIAVTEYGGQLARARFSRQER